MLFFNTFVISNFRAHTAVFSNFYFDMCSNDKNIINGFWGKNCHYLPSPFDIFLQLRNMVYTKFSATMFNSSGLIERRNGSPKNCDSHFPVSLDLSSYTGLIHTAWIFALPVLSQMKTITTYLQETTIIYML